MKKLLTTIIFTLVSSHSAAADEWTEFSSSSTEGSVKTYYSSATPRNNESLIRVWQTKDYAVTQHLNRDSFLSEKSLLEINCASKMLRTMAYGYYKQNMARGESIFQNSNPTEWAEIAPDVTHLSMAKFYCK